MLASAFYINDVPIECINQAAVAYYVPAELIISVLKTENGRVGMAKRNRNGTYDYGPMQINTIWLPRIRSFGFDKEMLQYDACANVWVGTWILAQRIASTPELAVGIGAYHSYTDSENAPYRAKVLNIYHLLDTYLHGV